MKDVTEEQLELLEQYSTKDLARIWHKAKQIVFQRNQDKGIVKKNGDYYYLGPKVAPVELDLIVLSRLFHFRNSKEKIKYKPLLKIQCTGECLLCPFGQPDISDEVHCTLPKYRVKIVGKPVPKK